MVTSVTSFGRSGVHDWLLQRFTAVVLLAYSVFIIYYLLDNPGLNYDQWRELFDSTWMRIFSLLTIFSVSIHSWIGLWSVSTDYIKPTCIRLMFQAFCGLLVFVFIVWGIQVLWGL